MPRDIDQIRRLAYNGEDIGMGFNSETGLAVGTALDFSVDPAVPAQEALSSFDIVTSHDSLMRQLNLSADEQGRYSFVSADLKVEFSKNTTYNSVSTFLVARMVIQNIPTRGKDFALKSGLASLLTPENIPDFKRAFGDCFVRGFFAGGEYYAVIRITSEDRTTQTKLGVTLNAELNGGVAAGTFKNQFSEANQSEHSRSEYSVTYFQRGGSGAPEIGTTLDIDDVKARLKSLPDAVARHALPYEIEVATYDTIPVPMPTPQEIEDYTLALADTEQKKLQYLQMANDYSFAAEKPDFFEDPPAAEVLVAASAVCINAVNAAIKHARKISSGEAADALFFDPALETPPIILPTIKIKKKLAASLTFRQSWLLKDDPSTTIDDRTLIRLVADIAIPKISDFYRIASPDGDAQKTREMQADALTAVIQNLTEFDLRNPWGPEDGVTSIKNLAGIVPPAAESLILHGHRLSALDGIEAFGALKKLDVSNNPLTSLTALRELKTLIELDISGTELLALDGIESLENLEVLSLEGTGIRDLKPLEGLTSLNQITLAAPSSETPIDDASALHASALANPFLFAERINVRWGKIPGGETPYTGVAERIGKSHRFSVNLTRGAETITQEWELQTVIQTRNFPVTGSRPEDRAVLIGIKDQPRELYFGIVRAAKLSVVESGPPTISGFVFDAEAT